MSDYKEKLKAAISEARSRRGGTIFAIAAAKGIELNGRGVAKQCPWCQKKDKLSFFEKEGIGRFKCPVTSCDGNAGGDEIGFLQLHDGLDLREATRAFLESAGVEHPWDVIEREKKDRSETKPFVKRALEVLPPPIEEPESTDPLESEHSDAPEFIKVPNLERNPFEEIWSLLTLTDRHQIEIRKKRGLDEPWIRAYGFKSSLRTNRELLSPVLDMFPPNKLLELGLAVKKKDSRELTIAHSLCGMGMIHNPQIDKLEPSFQVEPVIIPYFDTQGRIIDLRAHKSNLTNKNWLQEDNSSFFHKSQYALTRPYCEGLITGRTVEFENRCVITEGEFKAAALRRCGIPALGFPGMMALYNNKKFLNDLVDLLSRNDIREVAVIFDNECKDHKVMQERFEVEAFSQMTALLLERYQFRGKVAMLPTNWRLPDSSGKADWDGALSELFIKKSRSYITGITKASTSFREVVNSAKQVSMQSELWKGQKEAAIAFRLKKLMHEPKVFVGGKVEMDKAAEITRWCHPVFSEILNAETICQDLRATYGGYYTKSPLAQKERPRIIKQIDDINKIMEKCTSEQEFRQLKAALTLCYVILQSRPKQISDFTMVSRYKLRTIDGKEDRLVQFIDAQGVRSNQVYQLTGKRMSTATQFREFCLESGGYHWSGGQEAIDMVGQNLDVDNYQKVIQAIHVVGYQKETGIYIMGDCAIAPDGQYIFPTKDGIIWWKNSGYRYDENDLEHLSQKPPILFPNNENAKVAHGNINWEIERSESRKLLEDIMLDLVNSYGDKSGWLVLGMIIHYFAQPEIFASEGIKPGLWKQGRKGSGKTETMHLLMRILGFPSDFGGITATGTKVGIERATSQLNGLPLLMDEFRNGEVAPHVIALLRNAYSEQGQPKGMMDGSSRTRTVRPLTMPIVMGEDASNDPATMSRFVKVVMAESRRKGTPKEQQERFSRMTDQSEDYHRIGRYILHKRQEFAKLVVEGIKTFKNHPHVMSTVPTSRARQVYGTAWAAMNALYKIIIAQPEDRHQDLTGEIPEFASFATTAAEDNEREVFVVKFFDDCLTMIQSGDHNAAKFLRIERGHFIGHAWKQVSSWDSSGQLYLLAAPKELFRAYEIDKSKLHNEIPLSRQNIQLELRREPYWIEAHESLKPKNHRAKLSIDDQRRIWWIMDFQKMPQEMQDMLVNLLPEDEQDKLSI